MKKVVAFGPVIVVEGRLLVTKDGKDNFYKIPGGKPLIGESGEECCLRELREETGLDAKIVRPLSSLILDRNLKQMKRWIFFCIIFL
jgi:ADP-ribose pyrophosphatase YjhB (NUDIX family)